jgi:surfeit locus 1 family protein
MTLLKTLFNRRWWWVTIIVLLGMGVLARLGFWQLDRLEQRRAANAVLREQLMSDPLSLDDADVTGSELTEMADRAVTATGRFDFSEQMLLKLQNFNGSAGAHLITPLLLEGRQEAVLVDRGWIPFEEQAPENWDEFDVPGTVTIDGYIQLTETSRRASPPPSPAREWYRVNVQAMARQLPYEVLPVYVRQAPPPEGNQALPLREAPEFDLSEGPHLSYAIQWFIFTLMLGIGYLFFVKRQQAGASPK